LKTSELLRKYNIKLKKNLGQHLLSDDRIAKKIVEVSGISPDDIVVEIGVGAGTLTEELAKTGAVVIGYEIDERFKPLLENRLSHYKNVKIFFEDFLKVDVKTLPENVKFISNIPYNITGPILEKIFKTKFSYAVIMVQKEVADRILARPGTRNFGYISALSKVVCNVEKLFDVSRSHFVPNPQVDSTVVLLKRKKEVEDFEAFSFFLGRLFSRRRKTVRNNLKDLFEKPETIFEKLGIDPMKRPENLLLEDIINLFEEWYSWRRNSLKRY